MSAGQNGLGDGTAEYCEGCGEPYREVSRLPTKVGLCVTCFEEAMGGNRLK